MPNERTTSETVYVLDDDASVRRSIGRLLASEGLKFHTFSDPESLLASIEVQPVPVVILDIWMEKITGLEVQAKLSRLSPGTRVIIVTGRSDVGVQQTAMKLGAAAYFTKPFDDQEFMHTVRTLLAAGA